jgi:hypothetical protein
VETLYWNAKLRIDDFITVWDTIRVRYGFVTHPELEMCGTSPGPGRDHRDRDQKKNFTGTEKKLRGPRPGPKEKF